MNKLTLILKIIGQCEVKHIMMLPIKTLISVLKVSSRDRRVHDLIAIGFTITCAISAYHH